MQLVKAAQYKPGCCVLGGGHEDLVDFQRHMPAIDEGDRMYVSQQLIADGARLMGFKGPEEVGKLERRIADLHHELSRLEGIEQKLEKLQRAVGVTLGAGATIDQRTGKPKLRLPHGVKREEVEA